MTWSYRIIKTSGHYHDADGDQDWEQYAIHEVYYDDAGNPTGWSREPAGVVGDDLVELVHALSDIRQAFGKPVLVVTDDEKLKPIKEKP